MVSREMFNSPAFSHSIGASPLKHSQAAHQSKPSSSLDESSLRQLELATQILDERLEREQKLSQRAQLDSSLQGHSSSEYSVAPSADWAPLIKRRTIHLPDVLFDQYDVQQHRCLMGIFPEIERAWFTIDNRLFLWDYGDGTDFASFEQLDEIISAITIAKPKPGVFVSDIQHLLVIATPLTVTIVGLALKPASPPKSNVELSLYLTGLSVPTDGIVFTSIFCHNSTGRIFLVGSTDSQAGQTAGNELFEFEYRSEEGWFKKRCMLVNHSRGGTGVGTLRSLLPSWLNMMTQGNLSMMNIDQDRNLIYLLSKTNSIIMLTLGKSGQEPPTEVASATSIVRDALGMCPSAGPLLDPRSFEICGMHIISKQEGGKVGLVAISSQGVRMYFSHARRAYGYGYAVQSPSPSVSDQDSAPSSLWLCHVRLPPRNPPSATQDNTHLPNLNFQTGFPLSSNGNGLEDGDKAEADMTPIPEPLGLACSHYTSPGGFWVAAHSIDSESNTILAVAPDVAAQHLHATSSAAQVSNTSISRQQPQQQPQNTISEIASPIPIEGHAWAITNTTVGSDLQNNPMQMGGSPQEWLVLSNMGITVLSSQRPVDTLAALLDSMPGREQDLITFWERFGRDQTCAMSVCIAVGESSLVQTDPGSINAYSLVQKIQPAWGPEAIAQAKKLLHESSGRPEILNQGNVPSYQNASGMPDGKKILYSGKHEGLALYMAWLVRPIWKEKVVKLSPSNPGAPVSSLSEKTLTKVQRELAGLRHFIDNEMVLLTSLPDVRTAGRTDPAVYNMEQASIVGLRVLLTQAVEALSFVNLLMDYKISELITACPQEVYNTLLNLTYRDFITGKQGRDCARELVKTLINQQISQSFSVDAISETLQQRCGTFCTSDDVLLYKAVEALNKAKESQSSQEKRHWAREALRMFQKGAKHMSVEVLQDACTQFTQTAFLDGVVELALTCARGWDSGRQALAFWKDGRPKGDSRAGIYDLLEKCYACIQRALVTVDPAVFSAIGMSGAEASAVLDHAVQVALASDDELFHYRYFDWLLEQNKTMPLLETQTPYLESYLKAPPITLSKADLLWQYYTRNSAFFEAARILANLAGDDGLCLPLPRRIEYLSLAVSNAKSSPHLTSGDGEAFAFLTDIEEKLEVAQVQVEVLHNVMDLTDEDFEGAPCRKDVVLDGLQKRLLTISELYRDVVEPLSLLESTLLIFHVSDHRDLSLTHNVWLAIINQAHNGRPGGIQGPEAVASKVSELGRKFYPSDIAFNLPMIVRTLEKYAFDHPVSDGRRWVGPMLREAGVPWQVIWESIDELFTSKLPPWHVDGTLAFLAYELAGVIEQWLAEVNEVRDLSPNGLMGFPAARLDDVIDRYADALSLVRPAGAGVGPSGEDYQKAIEVLRMSKIRIRDTF